MSNTIAVEGFIAIDYTAMDIERLLDDIKTADKMSQDDRWDTDYDVLYWYVSGAVKSSPSKKTLIWEPCAGRSAHSWRSLRATLYVLGHYMHDDKVLASHNLKVADVMNSPNTWCTYMAYIAPEWWHDERTQEEHEKLNYGYEIYQIGLTAPYAGLLMPLFAN